MSQRASERWLCDFKNKITRIQYIRWFFKFFVTIGKSCNLEIINSKTFSFRKGNIARQPPSWFPYNIIQFHLDCQHLHIYYNTVFKNIARLMSPNCAKDTEQKYRLTRIVITLLVGATWSEGLKLTNFSLIDAQTTFFLVYYTRLTLNNSKAFDKTSMSIILSQ